MHKRSSHSRKKHILLAALLVITSEASQAFELAAGVAGVDESDDRYRPAASFHLGIGPSFYSRVYSYGRKLGSYTERTILSSHNYRFGVYGDKSALKAGIGGNLLYEETSFEPSSTSTRESETRRQYNFGVSFGLSYQIPLDYFYLSFDWDAHLYLAGSAGLFLATGRKHILGLSTGIHF